MSTAETDRDDKAIGCDDLLNEYRAVVTRSLFVSFGLDFLLFADDRRGGHVDTVANVRQLDAESWKVIDPADDAFEAERLRYVYASEEHAEAYSNPGTYDSHAYHSGSRDYRARRRDLQRSRDEGGLKDVYTGETLAPGEAFDAEHVYSAKNVHYDAVYAALDPDHRAELANSNGNLKATNPSLNRSKKDATAEGYMAANPDLDDEVAERMRQAESRSLASMDAQTASRYYMSSQFLHQSASVALRSGARMALRQVLGLVIAEVWVSLQDGLPEIRRRAAEGAEFSELLQLSGRLVTASIDKVKGDYREIIAAAGSGVIAGVLSELSLILVNMFAASAKAAGRIIRYCWSSVAEAFRIICFNPENLSAGELALAVAKVSSVGVSVVVGSLLEEALGNAFRAVPVVRDGLPAFVGAVATGIIQASLLYYLDHSGLISSLVARLNLVMGEADQGLMALEEAQRVIDAHAAELIGMDMGGYSSQVLALRAVSAEVVSACSEQGLNYILTQYVEVVPYGESLDDFMNDPEAELVF